MKKTTLILLFLVFVVLLTSINARADELGPRWEEAYKTELREAVQMFEKGYDIPKDQLYELGRTYLLRELHSGIDRRLREGKITPGEYVIMKTVFRALLHNNLPGGADLSKIPGVPREEYEKKIPATIPWKPNPDGLTQAQVEKYLSDNREKSGISDSVVTFLVRAPFAWNAFGKRLAGRKKGLSWQNEAERLAKAAQSALDKAGSIMENGTANLFSIQVPPAVRVNLINTLATSSEPKAQTMLDNMEAYEGFGATYGIHGWRGIAQKFLKNEWKQNHDATLDDFKKYLMNNHILLKEINLNNRAKDTLKDAGEKKLYDLFTDASIFVVD